MAGSIPNRIEDIDEADVAAALKRVINDPHSTESAVVNAAKLYKEYTAGKAATQKVEETRKPPKLKPVQDMTLEEREEAKAWALSVLGDDPPKPLQAWIS